jgi:acid phosphatase family membrane protein YuiD
MKLFQREPTLWLAVIYAIVTVVGTFGLLKFTGDQAALVNAAIAALFGAVNAALVRPISPVAFTYAIGAIVALAASYGFQLPDATLAAINGLVVPILALASRGQVSPEETPITNG